MVDDLTRRGPEDPNKININQFWEVNYWSEKFNIDSKKLILAVKAVGPMVDDVRKWLAEN